MALRSIFHHRIGIGKQLVELPIENEDYMKSSSVTLGRSCIDYRNHTTASTHTCTCSHQWR